MGKLILKPVWGESQNPVTVEVTHLSDNQFFRVGASFEMRYGVSIGELGDPFTFGTVVNDSILFTTSNRTAFLLGGAPNGLQVVFSV